MTLTVRLPQTLDQALEEYSASQGLTKSHVVQEALAEYLARTGKDGKPARKKVSATYAAFERAGLIGCFRGDGVSATKEVVRQKFLDSLKRKR